jgi:hypothetical protein
VKSYFINMLIALDQLLNALAGGYPDETISLHAARARDKGSKTGCVLCKMLDWFDKNHCDRVIASKHISILVREL